MSKNDVAGKLGFAVNGALRSLELQDGVILTYRPPEGSDWSAAGAAVARAMGAVKAAADAKKLYNLTARDIVDLADPGVWDGVAEWCISVELAARIVTDVSRDVAGERRTVEADKETFSFLFRLGENHARFERAVREAGRDLFTAKKE